MCLPLRLTLFYCLPPHHHSRSIIIMTIKRKNDQVRRQACNSTAGETETSDSILFRQPDSSHLGDCPICMLPQSLDTNKSMMQSCCTTLICIGCYYASLKYEAEKKILGKRMCPFCRQPEPTTKEEIDRYKLKRMKVNDPVAILEAGKN